MTGVYTGLLKRSLLSLNIGLAKDFVKLLNMMLDKILGDYEKYIFYFYLKLNEVFGQSQSFWSQHYEGHVSIPIFH